jgi:hypothetical protein
MYDKRNGLTIKQYNNNNNNKLGNGITKESLNVKYCQSLVALLFPRPGAVVARWEMVFRFCCQPPPLLP